MAQDKTSSDTDASAAEPDQRANYRKPTLTSFGPVAQMTGSNNGSIVDPNNPLLSGMIMNMDMDMDKDKDKDKDM